MMALNQPPFSGRNKLGRNRENPAAENKYERKVGTTVWDRSSIPYPSSFPHFLVFSLCRGFGLPTAHLPIHPKIFCMGDDAGRVERLHCSRTSTFCLGGMEFAERIVEREKSARSIG